MGILLALIGIVASLIVVAISLYLSAKLFKENLTWAASFLIALCGGIVGAIPWIGWLLSWIVMLILLKKWAGIDDIWPTGILLILIAGLIRFLLVILLIIPLVATLLA